MFILCNSACQGPGAETQRLTFKAILLFAFPALLIDTTVERQPHARISL